MTAPARTQQQPAATPLATSLVDQIIEQSVHGKDAHKRLAPFLTQGQSYDRIAAQVREAIIKVPKLAECDPLTILDAVVTIQRWRLEIGETAYLVPYGRKCTAVRGYIGDIELLINNGIARRVDAFCVYEKEPFNYREGTSPLLEHQPLAPSQRGKLLGAYAILWQTFTNCKAVFVFQEEVEKIREDFSKQWNEKTVGACPPWYSKKCAVKAVTKLLPKTPKLAKLRELMDEDEIVVTSARRGMEAVRPSHVSDDGEDLEDRGATDEPTRRPEPVASTGPLMRFGRTKGTPLGALTQKELSSAREWAHKTDADKFANAIDELDEELERRRLSSSNTQGEIPGLGDEKVNNTNALAQP